MNKIGLVLGSVLVVVGLFFLISGSMAEPHSGIVPLGHIYCPECNQTTNVTPIGMVQCGPHGYGGYTNGYMTFYCKNDGCIFYGYSNDLNLLGRGP